MRAATRARSRAGPPRSARTPACAHSSDSDRKSSRDPGMPWKASTGVPPGRPSRSTPRTRPSGSRTGAAIRGTGCTRRAGARPPRARAGAGRGRRGRRRPRPAARGSRRRASPRRRTRARCRPARSRSSSMRVPSASGSVTRFGIHSSPYARTRSSTLSPVPPTSTGGCGFCAGFGQHQIGSKSTNSPWYSASSCVQIAFIASMRSRMRLKRRRGSVPWLRISSRFQPAPTPNRTRPPESASIEATAFAVMIGSRCGTRQTPEPDLDPLGQRPPPSTSPRTGRACGCTRGGSSPPPG